MPRLVFTPRYLKMQKPSQVKNYVKYVATRPNAEKFEANQSQTEATEHQKIWVPLTICVCSPSIIDPLTICRYSGIMDYKGKKLFEHDKTQQEKTLRN